MNRYLAPFILLLGLVSNVSATQIGEVSVKIETPNPCFKLAISEVYSSDERSLVIAQIIPPAVDMGCMSAIGQASAKVTMATPLADKVDYVFLGRAWCWDSLSGEPTGFIFPRSAQELDDLKRGLSLVFSQPIPADSLPPSEHQWNNCEVQNN